MHVYGAWTGDNFTGRALWVRMLPDQTADSARTTVTGIRYACQDVQAGADVIRLLGK